MKGTKSVKKSVSKDIDLEKPLFMGAGTKLVDQKFNT